MCERGRSKVGVIGLAAKFLRIGLIFKTYSDRCGFAEIYFIAYRFESICILTLFRLWGAPVLPFPLSLPLSGESVTIVLVGKWRQ